MVEPPSEDIVLAWARLMRASQALLAKIESDLKADGFPPLAWYDVLLELSRAPEKRLRPFELEARTLLAQYNTSRLLDRMETAGLIARMACPEDKRGHLIVLTATGRDLRRRMWKTYGAALSRHVGARLSSREARELASQLAKLV
jgi:DNA-binding MarR family transcriptional regulator